MRVIDGGVLYALAESLGKSSIGGIVCVSWRSVVDDIVLELYVVSERKVSR